MSAYRTPTLTPPADTSPPLWQREVARFAPELGGAREWQWYRRAVGGRWCLVRLCTFRYSDGCCRTVHHEGSLWMRVDRCPAKCEGRCRSNGLHLAEEAPWPVDWHADPIHEVDEFGRCTCEVWP